MNYIKKFMEDNGIKEGENFEIIWESGGVSEPNFYFINNTLFRVNIEQPLITHIRLLEGKYKIKKLSKPFYPKKGECYFYYSILFKSVNTTFNDLQLTDMVLINNGFAFRTKKEAEAEENKQKTIDFYNNEIEKYNKLVESEE